MRGGALCGVAQVWNLCGEAGLRSRRFFGAVPRRGPHSGIGVPLAAQISNLCYASRLHHSGNRTVKSVSELGTRNLELRISNSGHRLPLIECEKSGFVLCRAGYAALRVVGHSGGSSKTRHTPATVVLALRATIWVASVTAFVGTFVGTSVGTSVGASGDFRENSYFHRVGQSGESLRAVFSQVPILDRKSVV